MSDSESSCTSPTPMSSSSSKPTNTKRCNKPQMERKRRERINVSLNMLKQLVLDALKKDTSQYSKLEKADILEMTVKHLRDLQRHQLVSAATSDVTVVGKYRAGFTECASEVTRYLGSVDGLKPEVRDRLMNHLSGCVQRVGTPTSADQHTHYMASGVATATSGHAVNVLPVSHPHTTAQPTVAATRPIQIQIPAATSPASLPGAGVQALQLAVTSGMSDAYQRGGSPSHQLPTPPPSQPGSPVLVQQQQQQHTSAAYSPVGAPAYMAAFQVIPNAGPFMQQMSQQQLTGIVHAATPIYTVASPVQQAQLQQMILSQAHLMVGTSTAQQTPTTTTSPGTTTHSVSPPSVSLKRQAESHHSDSSSQAVKRMMTKYNPICGGGLKVNSGVKVAINDTLREEQVWRPW